MIFLSSFCLEGVDFCIVLEVHACSHFLTVNGEFRYPLSLEAEGDVFTLDGAEYGFVAGREILQVDAGCKGRGTGGDEVEGGADVIGCIRCSFLFRIIPVFGTETLFAIHATLLEYALQSNIGGQVASGFIDDL